MTRPIAIGANLANPVQPWNSCKKTAPSDKLRKRVNALRRSNPAMALALAVRAGECQGEGHESMVAWWRLAEEIAGEIIESAGDP